MLLLFPYEQRFVNIKRPCGRSDISCCSAKHLHLYAENTQAVLPSLWPVVWVLVHLLNRKDTQDRPDCTRFNPSSLLWSFRVKIYTTLKSVNGLWECAGEFVSFTWSQGPENNNDQCKSPWNTLTWLTAHPASSACATLSYIAPASCINQLS